MKIDPDQPCDPSPKRRICFSRLPVFILLLAFFTSMAPAFAEGFKHRSFPARFGSEFGLGFAGNAAGVFTGTQLIRLFYESPRGEGDGYLTAGVATLIAAPILAATGTYYGGKLTGGDSEYVYPLMGATMGTALAYMASVNVAGEIEDPKSMAFLLTLPPLTSSIFYEAFSGHQNHGLVGATVWGILGGPALGVTAALTLPQEAFIPSLVIGALLTPVSVYLGGQSTGGDGRFLTTLKYAGISAGVGLVLLPIVGPNEYWAALATTALVVCSIIGYEKSNRRASDKEDNTGSQLKSAAQPMFVQLLNIPF